jgi:hypothetical protein
MSNSVLVVCTPYAPPVNFDVGVTSPGSGEGTYTGITAGRITLPQSGKLQSISLFWDGAGITFLLGLYSDASGQPGDLLASSTTATAAGGLNTLPISDGPTLAPGDYWLAVQNETGIAGYYDLPEGSAGAWNNGAEWTGVLPDTWPAASSGVILFSMYATFLT